MYPNYAVKAAIADYRKLQESLEKSRAELDAKADQKQNEKVQSDTELLEEIDGIEAKLESLRLEHKN